jgi:hypothetical protein
VQRIRYAWQWRTIEQEFLEGLESLKAQFITEAEGVTAHARFETQNESADQEYREIRLWSFPLDARPGLAVSSAAEE